MVSSDTDEYHAILKNKLYQVCTIVAFSYASVVKAGDSSVQVEIQALQSDLMFKVILLLGILASTLYFVHCYSVRFDNSCKTRALDYLGSELRVLWDDLSGTENYKWLGIEFNLHLRILVVSWLDATLLLDFMHDECNVICFLVFSKAEADGFQCVLASKGLLLLCDVRTPMVPLLCWAHDLDNPCFIDVIRSSLALSFVFNNISLLISICEAASRQMWATFPLDLLLAFSSHFELIDVAFDDMTMPLEFLVVPDLPQLPSFLLGEPSCRNIKWSHKMQLVGPTLPLPILFALYEFRNGYPNSEKMCGFSLNMKFGFRFNEVMRVTAEMAILDFCLLNNDESVSLTDDTG
ncbi:hypothetical protein Golob_026289 [Gossypium lobatum]|uniref:Uncharacterized protein n=1 Tax=Gossypium lobatum TaxID=34289 RepID=A0A7J8LUP7_9ROSI|nr:hypothetical protein [Gossypium lobatum]